MIRPHAPASVALLEREYFFFNYIPAVMAVTTKRDRRPRREMIGSVVPRKPPNNSIDVT